MMLRNIRESLVLFLIVLLPFHALMVTVGTKLLSGQGHPPLPILIVWKELMLGVIIIIALIEIVHLLHVTRYTLHVDVLDWLVLGLVVSGLVIPSSNFIFGFKYTLFPLCLFVVLRRVVWSSEFKKKALNVLLIIGGVVAGYGVLTLFLPQEFFTWLGYSDLHSLYIPDGPLAAFQQIGGTSIRRIQSTMSGPNQLGIWLLIPLSVVVLGADPLTLALSRRERGNILLLVLFTLALFLTFSRAAWIGAVVIVLVGLWEQMPWKRFKVFSFQFSVFSFACIGLLLFLVPNVLLRTASSRGHFEKPLEAIQTIIAYPLGLGLGSAGPASNRVSDPCVFLEEGADASWANDRPDFCVFVGSNQVQPIDKTCQCSFLPENWYLQVGVELGMLGFVLFGILVVLVLLRTHEGVRLMFLGVSIAALFLHSWEDSAVAYTLWILVAMMLPCTKGALWSSTSAASTRT